jgi:kynurenine 3-monooxygenase
LSLHLPLEGEPSFGKITSKADILSLFQHAFPNVAGYVSDLPDACFSNVTNRMLTIRCSPWAYKDRVVLIGDAAHAIVPYYGQGARDREQHGV